MRSQLQRQWVSGSRQTAAVALPVRCVAGRSNTIRNRSCQRVLCAAASFAPASPSSQPLEEVEVEAEVVEPEGPPRAFPSPLPMTSGQRALSMVPLFVFYPTLLGGIGAVAYITSLAARALPVEPAAKLVVSYVAAACAAAAAAVGAAQVKAQRDSVAVIELYNHIVELEEPHHLTAEAVQAIGSRYGITMQKDALDGVGKVYAQFLETIIPKGEHQQLTGDEAERVKAFKEALGLSDEAAAAMHMEVGRRLNRLSGFSRKDKRKDRQAKFDQLKSLQRLMYVSQVVFGDMQAASLLPWREAFSFSDAQFFVALRDNASGVFRHYLETVGQGSIPADPAFLEELRKRQLACKLNDETAAELVQEYTRKGVEGHLALALESLRFTGKVKDMSGAVEHMRKVVQYNRDLSAYSREQAQVKMLSEMAGSVDGADASGPGCVPGLGKVTVAGGPWAPDGLRPRDARDLYKMYLDQELARLGSFAGPLEQDAVELQSVLCLKPRDAQMLQDEVAAKLYRQLLREAVASKRLEQATSPASVLQELCEAVRFSPQGAQEFHRVQYRVKVESLITKGRLSEADAAELKKVRRMLCIPADVANKVMRDTAGKALQEVLTPICAAGPRPVLESEMQRVDAVIKEMRLDREVAFEVLAQVAKEKLGSYVIASQKATDRAGVATPLKSMVQFNALVVTPLLERVRGTEAAKKELAELLKQATEAAQKEEGVEGPPGVIDVTATVTEVPSDDPIAEARKALQARRGEFGEEEKKGQKEINLKETVTPEMRGELYKNYLMQSMQGEMIDLPVGGTIRKKVSEEARQTEMTRLQLLSDVLGMNQVEVGQVHQSLGEQAYKQQATDALRSGPLNESTMKYLEDMRTQIGLPKEAANKVLKEARTEVYGKNAPAEDGQRWTVQTLLAQAMAGIRSDTLLEEPSRRNLFRREVERCLTDGSGDVDADYVLKSLPQLLVLEERKVRMTLKELAASRKRRELVQAVSLLRQKRAASDIVASLQNLLSCTKLLPEEGPMEWPTRAEVTSVYGVYVTNEMDEAKQVALQRILGLSDAEVLESRAAAGGTAATLGRGEEVEESFF